MKIFQIDFSQYYVDKTTFFSYYIMLLNSDLDIFCPNPNPKFIAYVDRQLAICLYLFTYMHKIKYGKKFSPKCPFIYSKVLYCFILINVIA